MCFSHFLVLNIFKFTHKIICIHLYIHLGKFIVHMLNNAYLKSNALFKKLINNLLLWLYRRSCTQQSSLCLHRQRTHDIVLIVQHFAKSIQMLTTVWCDGSTAYDWLFMLSMMSRMTWMRKRLNTNMHHIHINTHTKHTLSKCSQF